MHDEQTLAFALAGKQLSQVNSRPIVCTESAGYERILNTFHR